MKKLVFATNNPHKLEEVRAILQQKFEVAGLADIGCHKEIPETGTTLEENASIKSHYVVNQYQTDCFADDTGLEVDAMDGKPGVYSARYAGKNASYEQNVDKLLQQMEGKDKRKARFRTVVSLVMEGKEYLFEGAIEGKIIHERKGSGGFGYDPVFVPDGYTQTFAEMNANMKNSISHRAKAVQKLADFLLHNG
jgi:XTP/dITP diphosphohydrolase